MDLSRKKAAKLVSEPELARMIPAIFCIAWAE